MKIKWKMLIILLLVSTLLVGIIGCVNKEKSEIIVGGKNYTEQYVMSEILSTLIEENTDLKTNIRENLSAYVIFEAMKSGEIDLHLEYVGSALMNMGMEPTNDPDKDYNAIKKEFEEQLNIKWLKPCGYNNTYAIAVTKETADKYNLKTVSDMAKVGEKLTFGCTYIFTERDDGYPGLSKHYDFKFADIKGMDASLMYQALVEEEVDAISAFTTDGQIAAFDLVLLEDDKQFFPPYNAAPIIRMEVLEKHPELEDVLNKLAGRIDAHKMAELNAAVDLDGREPAEVAREFLEEAGLIGK